MVRHSTAALICSLLLLADVIAILFVTNSGYEEENGEGAGAGTTINIPLGGGGLLSGSDIMDGDEVTDDVFITALERGMKKVVEHRPDVLVVSLGVDCYGLDPLASESWRKLSLDCFSRMSNTILSSFSSSSRPLPPALIVQEGGYHLEHMGVAVRNFLLPFVQFSRLK